MKIKLILAVVLCVLLSGISYGQNDNQKDSKRKRPSAEEMTKRDLDSLKSKLTLTEEQIPFIEKTLSQSYTKMQKVFQADPPDFSQMKTIMDERDENIKMVLTEEQIKKYTEYRENQMSRFKQGNRNN